MNDRMIGLLYVVTSIALESAGQISLKQAAARNSIGRNVVQMLWSAAHDKWLVAGIGCFVLEFISWTLALQRLDVSLAFQLSSLTFIAVAVSSHVWLTEQVTGYRWIGLICIFLGNILVGTS